MRIRAAAGAAAFFAPSNPPARPPISSSIFSGSSPASSRLMHSNAFATCRSASNLHLAQSSAPCAAIILIHVLHVAFQFHHRALDAGSSNWASLQPRRLRFPYRSFSRANGETRDLFSSSCCRTSANRQAVRGNALDKKLKPPGISGRHIRKSA